MNYLEMIGDCQEIGKNILKKVNEQRMNLASEKLKSCIDEMLKVSSSDDELEAIMGEDA